MPEHFPTRVYADRKTGIWKRLHQIDGTGEYADRITEYLRGISRFDEKQTVLDSIELILNIEDDVDRMLALDDFLRSMGRRLFDNKSVEGRYEFFKSITDRLAATELFNSPEDQQIAADLFNRLQEKFSKQEITQQLFVDGLAAMDAVLPRRNEKGRRVIGGIQITPVMEKVIQSRLDSEEVDAAGPEGSWGSLPETVRQEIVSRVVMMLEMTTTCTVKCSFCALAEKGPIEKKMSFDSVLSIMKYFIEQGMTPIDSRTYLFDGLYWGTDVFDAKWLAEAGRQLDYSDLALKYWELSEHTQRVLYTSTAIPLGEEMRVLKFAQIFLDKRVSGQISSRTQFRISRTDANTKRADAISTLLHILYGETTVKTNGVVVTENRNQGIAKAGVAWQNATGPITVWDVLGPNCRDGVLVKVQDVEAVVMVASSNERPIGEERASVFSRTSDGAPRYTIPHYQISPGDSVIFKQPDEIYPNTVVTHVQIQSGRTFKKNEVITQNPHRALLRMLGYLKKILMIKHQANIELMNAESKAIFVKHMQEEIELVRSYLAMGADNVSMKYWMKEFTDRGFFPETE